MPVHAGIRSNPGGTKNKTRCTMRGAQNHLQNNVLAACGPVVLVLGPQSVVVVAIFVAFLQGFLRFTAFAKRRLTVGALTLTEVWRAL